MGRYILVMVRVIVPAAVFGYIVIVYLVRGHEQKKYFFRFVPIATKLRT